ncbi:MAG: prepilin-type N-terminal cleavage/methylation domain-containing protein [Gaiellaceae bacterium]|jgi:prepilin-type N-terminal cleavage/methylation domain-containing protein
MLRQIGRFVSRIQRRLEGEEGFTLVELMIVLLIFGILLTIAVPSYLSLEDRANKTAAKQDIAQAMRAVNAYANDNFPDSVADPDPSISTTDNGYENISLTALATKYDASISAVAGAPFVLNPAGYAGSSVTDFCLTAAVGRWVAVEHGPGGGISVGTLFTPGTCSVS